MKYLIRVKVVKEILPFFNDIFGPNLNKIGPAFFVNKNPVPTRRTST